MECPDREVWLCELMEYKLHAAAGPGEGTHSVRTPTVAAKQMARPEIKNIPCEPANRGHDARDEGRGMADETARPYVNLDQLRSPVWYLRCSPSMGVSMHSAPKCLSTKPR